MFYDVIHRYYYNYNIPGNLFNARHSIISKPINVFGNNFT
jgi:hypothetical protein